jgi:ATP-dependent DNA ligase
LPCPTCSRHGALTNALLCAFDPLELDGKDLRPEPIEKRKQLLKGQQMSIILNQVYELDGEIVFREARTLRCDGPMAALAEGQNLEAPAIKREAEEHWGRAFRQ